MNTKKIISSSQHGLTLIEVMVAIAIVSILVLVAVPSLSAIVPTFQLRTSARGSGALMEQARLMANNCQKPVRVVLDCRDRHSGDNVTSRKPCKVNMYVASFDHSNKGGFNGWLKVGGDGGQLDPALSQSSVRQMGTMVNILPSPSNPLATSINDHPDGLFWAVFYPTGRTQTSHSPMVLNYTAQGSVSQWRLSLNCASGQVSVKKTN